MSEEIQDWDEILPHEQNGEVVHWMAPKPLSIGPAGISAAAAAAFALGAVATLAVLAAMRRLNPPVVEAPVRRWRRR